MTPYRARSGAFGAVLEALPQAITLRPFRAQITCHVSVLGRCPRLSHYALSGLNHALSPSWGVARGYRIGPLSGLTGKAPARIPPSFPGAESPQALHRSGHGDGRDLGRSHPGFTPGPLQGRADLGGVAQALHRGPSGAGPTWG